MIDTLHSPSRNGRVRSARKWREEDANRPDNDSQKSESTEEESEDDEELEEPAAEPSSSAPVDPSTARAAKKAQKQQAKARATGAKAANEEDGDEEDEDDLINPNHATPKKFKASDLDSASPEPSRRERYAPDPILLISMYDDSLQRSKGEERSTRTLLEAARSREN